MAFIGNIVGAYAAQQIGEYNAQLYNQQAAYADAKAQRQSVAYVCEHVSTDQCIGEER